MMIRTPESWMETLSGLPSTNAAYAILSGLPGYDWHSPRRTLDTANLATAIEALMMLGAAAAIGEVAPAKVREMAL